MRFEILSNRLQPSLFVFFLYVSTAAVVSRIRVIDRHTSV